jgi:hypothetical protein
MAGSGSVRRSADEDDVLESQPMVDLKGRAVLEIDDNDSDYQHSRSDKHHPRSVLGSGTHIPDEYDESENLLQTEETLPGGWTEKRSGWAYPAFAAIGKWVKGPNPPRSYKIEPYFSRIQTAPIRLLEKRLTRTSSKIWSFLFFVFFWILVFASILYKSVGSADIPGYGPPVRLSCVSRLW